MSRLTETAYPRLPTEIGDQDLASFYTPTQDEWDFVQRQSRQSPIRACLCIQLKLLQRLGFFIPVEDAPIRVVQHICRHIGLRPLLKRDLARYDRSGSKSLHLKKLRAFTDIRALRVTDRRWLEGVAHQAAQTKHELPDIINVMIEELIKRRFELPGFTLLARLARQARADVNERIYRAVAGNFSAGVRERVVLLLGGGEGQSNPEWDDLKREPKRLGPREVESFLRHIEWLMVLANGLPDTKGIPAQKREQLVLEARALNLAEMRALKVAKRHTLAVLLIQSQLQKAMDDVAEMFIKTLAKLHALAEERLREHHLARVKQTDRLVGQFRQMLTALQSAEAPEERLAQVEAAVGGDPETWIAQCDEHIAFASNNYYPFLMQLYRHKRFLLLHCLDVLKLKASSQDESLLRALTWVQQHRTNRRVYVSVSEADQADLALDWISEKWRNLVVGEPAHKDGSILIHRRYFELCVMSEIMRELKSADLYVEHSSNYDDHREHLVSWDEYTAELGQYGEIAGIPVDAKDFVASLREQLASLAERVDHRFPKNEHVDITASGLVIRRIERAPPPSNIKVIDQAITEALEEISIVDVLTDAAHWLDLHRLFGPLSGFESKIDEPRKRFITALFCHGCNLGPTQTARSMKGFSRKQIAWLNLKHVTEERLDKAIIKVINAYNRFALPRFWGSGKHASADGTKWNVYEQNLLSEYHIRYGGYGGIGYYHVSDTYIALFSHFIPCGVYEAVYILDGLIKNESDIQPDTVHGDTHAQSATAFGLAHLLGIKLMPRIRGIKDLVFYKPEKGAKYQHIQALFKGEEAIDWDLIARHFPDMLRVAISIKAGKITPSMILRRFGTSSRKNKQYFAFRELGRAVRTLFLLNYINDIELRQTIHAATNKSEEFNQFAQWLFFGGEGIIAENVRHEQRKIIKYNQLVANMVILHNVQSMSRVLKDLQREGHVIDEALLKALAPYRTSHINRFGDYTLDMERAIDPIDFDFRFNDEKSCA